MRRAPGWDVECTFLDAEGEASTVSLRALDPVKVVRGRPVRSFPSHAALRHYPGWWWSSTMQDLVGYESLLERDCLMMADQDPEVCGVASQPLWLQGLLEDGRPVRHVPDYLVAHRDGTWTLVDVKPSYLVERPEVGKVLSWTGKVAADRGWGYQVWSGAPAQRLANLHFLAQGRRSQLVAPEIAAAIARVAEVGMTLALLQRTVAAQEKWPCPEVRSALICCLWFGSVSVDLDRPVANLSVVTHVRRTS